MLERSLQDGMFNWTNVDGSLVLSDLDLFAGGSWAALRRESTLSLYDACSSLCAFSKWYLSPWIVTFVWPVYRCLTIVWMTVDVRQTPHGPHGSQGKPIPSSSDNSAPWGEGGICGSQRLFIAADCSNRTKTVAHGCHAPWMTALMACHGRRPGFTACRQWNCSLSSCDYRGFAMAWIVVSGQTTHIGVLVYSASPRVFAWLEFEFAWTKRR